ANPLHQEREDSNLGHCRRARRRMSCVAVLRILARAKDARCANAAHHLSRRRPPLHRTQAPGRSNGADHRVVRQIFEVATLSSRAESRDLWNKSGAEAKLQQLKRSSSIVGFLLSSVAQRF